MSTVISVVDPNIRVVVDPVTANKSIDILNSKATSLQVLERIHCTGDLSFNGQLLQNGLPFVVTAGGGLPAVQSFGPIQQTVANTLKITFPTSTNVAPAGFTMTNLDGTPSGGDFRAVQEGQYTVGFGSIDTVERTDDETVDWFILVHSGGVQKARYQFIGSGLATVYLKVGDWVTPVMGNSPRSIKSTSKFVLQKIAGV